MPDKFQDRYRIPSARATFHDYNGGTYFVTVCTAGREHFFGEIVRDCNPTAMTEQQMVLSPMGQYADKCWREIPQHFPHVEIPLWVIMPNHIHGIIIIHSVAGTQNDGIRNVVETQNVETQNVETQNFASLQQQQPTGNKFGPQSKNLASVIRGFKIGVTKFANENNISFAWQPRFYDRIIRNTDEMNRIAEYIEGNVARWGTQDEDFLRNDFL